MPRRLELGELLGHVSPGEDARVDRGVEGLDLAAEELAHPGELGDGLRLDAVLGQVLAGPVAREELDVQRLEAARECGDAVACRDGQQGSQPLPSIASWVAEYSPAHGILGARPRPMVGRLRAAAQVRR